MERINFYRVKYCKLRRHHTDKHFSFNELTCELGKSVVIILCPTMDIPWGTAITRNCHRVMKAMEWIHYRPRYLVQLATNGDLVERLFISGMQNWVAQRSFDLSKYNFEVGARCYIGKWHFVQRNIHVLSASEWMKLLTCVCGSDDGALRGIIWDLQWAGGMVITLWWMEQAWACSSMAGKDLTLWLWNELNWVGVRSDAPIIPVLFSSKICMVFHTHNKCYFREIPPVSCQQF